MAVDTSAIPRKNSARQQLINVLRAALKPLYWWYEKRLEAEVRHGHVPRHLGMILDGNRRFARELGLAGHEGPEFGVQKAYEVL